MATFLESGTDAEPRPHRFGAKFRSRRSSSWDADAPRVLVDAVPIRYRVVVADIGTRCRWSADAFARMSAAVSERRPNDVIAWDLAGRPSDGETGARRIAADLEALLTTADLEPYLATVGGVDFLAPDAALTSEQDVADVATVLTHHRHSVVVHARVGTPSFAFLVADADVVVVPVSHSDSAAAAIADMVASLQDAGLSAVSDRVVVVRTASATEFAGSGSTEMRRALGEAGVRTVLDVPVQEMDGAWARVVEVILRRQTAAPEERAPAIDPRAFEVTTETLRAQSEPTVRRSRLRLPVLAAVGVLVLAAALAAAVLLQDREAPDAVTRPASGPAAVDPVRASPEAVIAQYDEYYYVSRDAVAAASMWDLSDPVNSGMSVADLQQSIDAVDPAIRHRIDVTPTADPSVLDAVLTLTTADGRDYFYPQQFVVRAGDEGYAIVSKIDCDGTCPPP